MTYGQPANWHTRAMVRDDTAPHQIRVVCYQDERIGMRTPTLVTTCTCTWRRDRLAATGWWAVAATADEGIALHAAHAAAQSSSAQV